MTWPNYAARPAVDPIQPSKRAPEPLGRGAGCVVRDPGCAVPGIVCVRPCLSASLPAMAGLSVLAWLTRAFELDRGRAKRDPDPRAVVPAPSYVQGWGFQPWPLADGSAFGWRRSCELRTLIGIGWKGTRPPLKTISADTLIFNLRMYSGGAVAI